MGLGRLTGLSLLVALTACQTKAKEEKQPAQAPIDWTRVATALGKAGAIQPGEVYRVSLPRGDLHVTLGGVQLKPALALGSWVGFKQTGSNEVTVMGDLVLLENEIGLVAAKLQEGGIEQTGRVSCTPPDGYRICEATAYLAPICGRRNPEDARSHPASFGLTT